MKMDNTEVIIRKYCCTCLSYDRNLFQLCKISDGVNNLYWLLSYDLDAYREGFHRDSANLFICWECKAVMSRICGFRSQVCLAQKQLSLIAEGQNYKPLKILSNLSQKLKITYDCIIVYESPKEIDNFIDCGPIIEKKTESDTDDIPLAELQANMSDDSENTVIKTILCRNTMSLNSNDCNKIFNINRKLILGKKKHKNNSDEGLKEISSLVDRDKRCYSIIEMNEEEMCESRTMRKLAEAYVDAAFKCESCVQIFKVDMELYRHDSEMHSQRDKYSQCDICLSYIRPQCLTSHRKKHYIKFVCQFCDVETNELDGMLGHLDSGHDIRNLCVSVKRPKRSKKLVKKSPLSKQKRNETSKDQRTPFGFLCTECNKYFENKNLRWKHVQKCHREGFECSTCGKKFPFKNNLSRHELTHGAPPVRVACAQCGARVRADLLRVHARIHTERERLACAPCARSFASRASYEHHLKYTLAHAVSDILKYKCSTCDKGYRSKGELRDHINYQHMGKTQHKCPVCGKALATKRCVTRHVRRAHHGVKESERDKMCQQCGKAFRDKKGLREHEFIHTGERPLSCEICGCTFRQSASLYTHRKRVHKIYPLKKTVQLMDSDISK